MNGDDHNSSDDDTGVPAPNTALQDRRRKYYEERKKKMSKSTQAVSMADMLNSTDNLNPIENEKRFINIKVHTRIAKGKYNSEEDDEDNLLHLIGELEIADYLTFAELVPKTIEMLNSHLKAQGSEIELLTNWDQDFSFRYAKKTGLPDTDFPSFDSNQKVSDCGVTNVWLMHTAEWIRYPQSNPSKVASTVAETENYSEIMPKEMKSSKQGAIKKSNSDMDRMSQSNSSCKCAIF